MANETTKNEKKPQPTSAPKPTSSATPPAAGATAPPGSAAQLAQEMKDGTATFVSPTPEEAPRAGVAPAPPERPMVIDFEKLGEAAQRGAADCYVAYQGNAGGKAHDGKPMPAWANVGNLVRSHWAAVWIMVYEGSHSKLRSENDSLARRVADLENAIAEAASVKPDQALVVESERLKRELAKLEASTGAVEQRKIDAAVAERVKLLESETDKLRAQVAQMEREKATGFKPWANRSKREDPGSSGG